MSSTREGCLFKLPVFDPLEAAMATGAATNTALHLSVVAEAAGVELPLLPLQKQRACAARL